MRGLHAPYFDPPRAGGGRYAKPHLFPLAPGELFIPQPGHYEEGKRLARHFRGALAPFWVCTTDPMKQRGVGIGDTQAEAWDDWRSRLPWWRRWLVPEAKPPKYRGHVPPRPVPPPAQPRPHGSGGYKPTGGTPGAAVKPPPRKP